MMSTGYAARCAPETRFKRRYRVLRIPREALDKFIIESRVQ